MRFTCPECKQSFKIQEKHIGKTCNCPACQKLILINYQEFAPSPVPRPEPTPEPIAEVQAAVPEPKPSPTPQPLPVTPAGRSPRHYPAMAIIIWVWKILACVAFAIWVVGFLFLVVTTFIGMREGLMASLIINGLAFMWLSLSTLLPALVCYATAESMQVIIHIQDNTFRVAEARHP